MEEENRRFSWINFFIKGIIIIIFVLFTVWLLSLSNKDINKSLDVLTDNIFAENIDRMKDVGQSYFTIERLPEKVGEVKTLSLAKMYDEKLILELKDKYGNACSASNSYVSIEKLENEYHMKVYLECGEESDYIIVIMGCYDYCDTDICERKETTDVSKQIEYEYKKTTGGSWTNYGSWSEWSKVSVTKTNYRDVETKVVKEEYSYDKTVFENEYVSLNVSCPSGYSKTSDGTRCFKNETKEVYTNPIACDSEYNGYTLVSQDGFTCNYKKTTTTTKSPSTCPSTYNGYTLKEQNGFTCTYVKDNSYTVNPEACATYYNGYNLLNQDGFTCNYRKIVDSYMTRDCSTCVWYQQNVYAYTSTTVGCPSGSVKSNNSCVVYSQDTQQYNNLVSCESGYTKSGNSCVKSTVSTTKTTVGCPSGYSVSGSSCVKKITNTKYTNIIKSCPTGYNFTSDNSKCYKEVASVVKVTGTKDVTYYRYRIREYVGGTVDYKWSKSKEDKDLLNAGYVLTGRTR